MEKDFFTTFDVAKIVGIKRTRLQEWLDRGYIKPSIQKARGQGTKALFSKEDLYAIKLFGELLKKGFTRNRAASILGLFEEGLFQDVRKADWGSDYLHFGEEFHTKEFEEFSERPAFSAYTKKSSPGRMPDSRFFQGQINLKVIKKFVDERIG